MKFISLCWLLMGMTCATAILQADRFMLSSEGSGRATAYMESPKIISWGGKTHVAWLDTPPEGFRIRIRTLDHESGEWSGSWTVGRAEDNHGGPALTVDREGYLHIIYYSHHHPFRYRRSTRPNDASSWTDYEEFGINLTYPALVCAKDGTLILTARRSYEDRPWELEMWKKPPGKQWKQALTLLRSCPAEYAQFGASLAWSSDHRTLHLSTRIYEMSDDKKRSPITTVGYLKSPDGGMTWTTAEGTAVILPATADTIDVLARGDGRDERVLAVGSMGIGPDDVPYIPYSIRLQDSSHAFLASYHHGKGWKHQFLNEYLPAPYREWDLFMHGGISFGQSGSPLLMATMMKLAPDKHEWGLPSTELVRFRSLDKGITWIADAMNSPDAAIPRWMPNVERPTGFNHMPEFPAMIYTDGVRGETLEDQLENQVIWIPGEASK